MSQCRAKRAEKLADQAAGVAYGCHLELDAGELPDDCVKDYGADGNCTYARLHKTREACRFWQPRDANIEDAP